MLVVFESMPRRLRERAADGCGWLSRCGHAAQLLSHRDGQSSTAREGDFDDDFDDDDYDYEGLQQTGEESGVQLGTVRPLEGSLAETVLFKSTDWHEWDGGKAGGWPVWLNPRDLPATQDMRCGECTQPLSFLVQLYCPLDHQDDAFHRCLYVFCCPKGSCSNNSSAKVLRCQLPRDNNFYPYEPDDKIDVGMSADQAAVPTKQQAGADPAAWGVNVCCVCGQLAKSACSKCRTARYCGREHQSQHWKAGGHKKLCNANASLGQLPSGAEDGTTAATPTRDAEKSQSATPPQTRRTASVSASVFREYEVEVRPEPPPPPAAPDGRTAEDTLMSKMGLGNADGGDDGAVDGEDDDSKLSQAELDKVAGVHGVKDKVTLHFLTRTQANPQVVRYDAVGAGPLWSSSKSVPGEADVPPCGRCGRARKFEFQVMPHLLHHLGVDANAKALDAQASGRQRPGAAPPLAGGECMDWGTLAVYTCPDSCPFTSPAAAPGNRSVDASVDGGAVASGAVGYVEEFVWRQPPP